MRAWHFFMVLVVRALVFRKVFVRGPLPEEGAPVLYVGFHRNGAVDGWVYSFALGGRAEFMVAARLVRHLLARFFFSGIEVMRPGDPGPAASNRKGLALAVARLEEGGDLFVFPEGSSTLGPKHLPFQKGAAFIAARALKCRPDLRIVPLTVRYAAPQLWGSDVEVAAGKPLVPGNLADDRSPGPAELHTAITEALEALDPDLPSDQALEEASALAALLAPVPPACALRFAAEALEGPAGGLWRQYREEARPCKKWRGIAPFPKRSVGNEVLAFLASALCVASAALLNAPAVCAGYWAGRRLPDGPNVVLLWKTLAGLTVLLAVLPFLWGALFLSGMGWGVPVHVVVTVLGCRRLDSLRRSWASLWNFFRHRPLRPRLERLEEALRDAAMARHTGP